MQPLLAIDVDGVLVDPIRAGRGNWTDDLREQLNVDLDLTTFFRGPWQDVIVGRVAVEQALHDWLGERGHPVEVEEFLDCWLEGDFSLNGEVIDACRDWASRGLSMFLATNQEHRRAKFLAERLGPMLSLSGIAYSAALGATKPSAEFYLAADKLIHGSGVSPVVFLDDTITHVEAARAHGWHGVHFSGPSWREEVEAKLDALSQSGTRVV